MTGKETKIDNSFNRVMDDVNRLQKAFQPGKNLEKAIAEVGGDISWMKDINEAFDNLYDKLEEGHMGAVAHLQMEESAKKQIKEGVLDADDDDGFMARSQLYFMARDAITLHGIIDDRDDLEPWVQSKIAQASKDIDAVRRYTEYNSMEQSQEPEVPAVIPGEEPQDEMPTIDVQMPAEESVLEEKDPDTAFVRWLKDKYNKSPRDLKGDEYVKMSKEFQASKKKDESISEAQSPAQKAAFQKMLANKKGKKKDDGKDKEKEDVKEEMKFDDKRDADLKVFAKDLYKKAVKKAKSKANK
tara:strand:- start:461 stop:1357 length:897 start_codon:yes stop_codon:yes gene_type:complete